MDFLYFIKLFSCHDSIITFVKTTCIRKTPGITREAICDCKNLGYSAEM